MNTSELTDLQDLKNTFTRLGIPFKEEVDDGHLYKEGMYHIRKVVVSITIEEGIGYSGSNAIFYFLPDGTFLSHGVWG